MSRDQALAQDMVENLNAQAVAGFVAGFRLRLAQNMVENLNARVYWLRYDWTEIRRLSPASPKPEVLWREKRLIEDIVDCMDNLLECRHYGD